VTFVLILTLSFPSPGNSRAPGNSPPVCGSHFQKKFKTLKKEQTTTYKHYIGSITPEL